MSTPIFLLVLVEGYKEAWHHLSKQEQDDLWAKANEIDRQAGAVWRIACDSRWTDEGLFGWAVLEYPSFDAYRQKVAALEELNWFRYVSTKTVLGTESTMGNAQSPTEDHP